MTNSTPSVCRVALVTNIPAPYRLPVYNAIGTETGVDLHIVFCAAKEPNREWNLPPLVRPHYFLKDRFVTVRGHFIHFNIDVLGRLRSIAPDVVITTGFNPTHLLAVMYAAFRGLVHIPMTDGTVVSERTLGPIHRFVRRRVYRRSRAFVAAAEGGLDIYRSYDCDEKDLFRSMLCVNNAAFIRHDGAAKRYDLLFCGRLVDIKNPLFVLNVARLVARDLTRKVSVCFVGSGPLETQIREAAAGMPEVEVSLLGFAAQEDLPLRYAEARIFLLPSLWDPWGVVANEACAAGLPVICSPHAGVAGELVRDGKSGFVRDLDTRLWADAAVRLLQDERLYAAMSGAARKIAVEDYNFEAAADGITAAVRHGKRISDDGPRTAGSRARR